MQENGTKLLIISILCLLLSVGTVVGYKIGKDISDSGPLLREDFEVVDNLPIIEIESIETNANVEYEYTIIKQTEYDECEHIYSSENKYLAKTLDEALEKVDIDYELITKGTDGAIISEKNVGCCPNHYVVSIANEKVVIYRKKNKEEKEIYRELDVSINTLREDLINDLKQGIEVNSSEELNTIIEEIES